MFVALHIFFFFFVFFLFCFFFFKQKTAYEIVSRDWSSDVCSSDLQLLLCIFCIVSGLVVSLIFVLLRKSLWYHPWAFLWTLPSLYYSPAANLHSEI